MEHAAGAHIDSFCRRCACRMSCSASAGSRWTQDGESSSTMATCRGVPRRPRGAHNSMVPDVVGKASAHIHALLCSMLHAVLGCAHTCCHASSIKMLAVENIGRYSAHGPAYAPACASTMAHAVYVQVLHEKHLTTSAVYAMRTAPITPRSTTSQVLAVDNCHLCAVAARGTWCWLYMALAHTCVPSAVCRLSPDRGSASSL